MPYFFNIFKFVNNKKIFTKKKLTNKKNCKKTFSMFENPLVKPALINRKPSEHRHRQIYNKDISISYLSCICI